MSEFSVYRTPDLALPLLRADSQRYGAGIRPDSAQGQMGRYIVAAAIIALPTWNQSQIFDVEAAAVAESAATPQPVVVKQAVMRSAVW